MRDDQRLTDLVGFTRHNPEPMYHRVQRLDGEGRLGVVTGMSECASRLIYVAGMEAIRPHERACKQCFHQRNEPPRTPRVAQIRPSLIEPVCPVGPLAARVSFDGLLAVKSSDDRWLVIDPERPLLLEYATNDAALEWPTLRSTWPAEQYLGNQWLADRYDVERSTVRKWQIRGQYFPRQLVFIGDHGGHAPEQLPKIDLWVATRRGRSGRPPKDRP